MKWFYAYLIMAAIALLMPVFVRMWGHPYGRLALIALWILLGAYLWGQNHSDYCGPQDCGSGY